ncbi:hypothetical protein [Rubrivirga sp. IMCC45206]|uniref:hypothetical protein n=1 Tax=Rubrivirga sp. IMCC45206 TaxID=3391614 RepID=UPI0039903A17
MSELEPPALWGVETLGSTRATMDYNDRPKTDAELEDEGYTFHDTRSEYGVSGVDVYDIWKNDDGETYEKLQYSESSASLGGFDSEEDWEDNTF